MVAGFGDAVVAALLLVVTIDGAHQLWQFVALAALTGAIGALGNPAGRSLVPELVPAELLTGAIALRSIAGQAATIGGPALGGLPLRAAAGGGLRRRGRYARRLVARAPAGRRGRSAALEPRRARASQTLFARHPLHPRDAGDPRRDHARPVRGAVRRRGRAAAALREVDPSHRAVRARRAAQHGRGRRAGRRHPARAQAARRARRPHAAARRRRPSARAWSCSAFRGGSGCRRSRSR